MLSFPPEPSPGDQRETGGDQVQVLAVLAGSRPSTRIDPASDDILIIMISIFQEGMTGTALAVWSVPIRVACGGCDREE
jgi:hypothetical protein